MTTRTYIFCTLALLGILPASEATASVTASYRYSLSNFSGVVQTRWTRLAIDPARNEVFVLDQRSNDIRIFDENGMQIFVFGEGFPLASDLAIAEDGSIFVLSCAGATSHLDLLNYRGEPVAPIPLSGVPEKYAKFAPDHMAYRQGRLYLADTNRLIVVVVDEAGRFERAYDLGTTLKPFMPRQGREQTMKPYDWRERKVQDVALNDFSVDADGNMLFTVPAIFGAFRMSPDGDVVQFGKAGSGKGRFGVTAGITADDDGYVYVTDRLRSVVLVFDPDLEFQIEFGYRGLGPSNLIVPDDLVVDRSGNVYVGQASQRGVSVFRVVHEKVRQSQDGDATSTGSEKSRPVIEEEVESGRTEFGVDRGGDAEADDSEVPGWTIENNESTK